MDNDLFKGYGPGFEMEWLEQTFAPQSVIFYADLAPALYQLCISVGRRSVRVLDIGPGSANGTAFVRDLFANLLGIAVEFEAIDIGAEFEKYVKAKHPRIGYSVGDAFALAPGSYDIVLASHVVEHVDDPIAFIASCNRIARHACLFFAPYNEKNLIPAHKVTIDDDVLAKTPGLFWARWRRSLGWSSEDGTVLFATVADGAEMDRRALAMKLHDAYEMRALDVAADACSVDSGGGHDRSSERSDRRRWSIKSAVARIAGHARAVLRGRPGSRKRPGKGHSESAG